MSWGVKYLTAYWKNMGKLGREAFAYFGSASIRKDMKELTYLEHKYSNAYNYFKAAIIKKGKNI